MKTKEDAYYFIAYPLFSQTSDGNEVFRVTFLYCDDVFMMACLRKKKGKYEVHYPAIDQDISSICDYVHMDFRKENHSYSEIIPYFYYFKNINHAKAVEKEIKLAFRRWLKSEKE